MDLYIGEITREQLEQVEKACAFFGKFYWRQSLQKMWYLNEEKIREIFGKNSFRQIKSGNHRYLGPVLATKSKADEFLTDIKAYQDDNPVKIDTSKIRTHFMGTRPLPQLTNANVVVFHGEYYYGKTVFDIPLNEPFSMKQLRLNLVDCGENGFVLQSISYRKKSYAGREVADSRGFLKPQFIVKES